MAHEHLIKQILELRQRTGESLNKCRAVVELHFDDVEAQLDHLRSQGQLVAGRRTYPCGCRVGHN